jgi:hydrogenase maturation protease
VTRARVLVAGLGNVLFGDDAFGPAVAQRLARRPLGETVRVVDVGIRGIDLAFELLEGYDAAILVDATSRGGAPGTLYVLEPGDEVAVASLAVLGGHDLVPATVLAMVRSMGGALPPYVRVVGCEPAVLTRDGELLMELSPPVAAAIEPAIAQIESLLAELAIAHEEHLRA